MKPITEKYLQARLDRINTLRKAPLAPYAKRDLKGHRTIYTPNIGCWHFDHAYGGIALHEMTSATGGVTTIKHGYGTKREMDTFLDGVIKGLEAHES